MKHVTVMLLILVTSIGYAQETNKEIDLKNGRKILVGPITIEGLQQQPYAGWYQTSYSQYTVDTDLVGMFKKKLRKHTIKLFLGTWCGDSRREVPRMLKLLERADFPLENLEIIALDSRKPNYKKSPGGEEQGWDIRKVPTMILLRNGKETNRIVESPIASLEEDILSILNNKGYLPNYSIK